MRAWKFWDSGEGRREGLIRWEDKNFLRTVISASLEIGGPSSCVLLEIGPSVRHDWKIIRVDCSVASFSFVFFFFSRIESYATGVAKERFESSSINWGKRKNIKKKKKRKKRPKKRKKKENARYTWRFLILILPRLMWSTVSWKSGCSFDRPNHSRLFQLRSSIDCFVSSKIFNSNLRNCKHKLFFF